MGGTNSGTALAMNKVASEKKRVYINIGAGTARLDQRRVLAVHGALRV